MIPTIAVPVVLLGTFGIFAIAGFSINTLTLFGLVLAIGLLVDDAIVVVEKRRASDGRGPRRSRRATRRSESMDEITVALVAIALVLSAVFLPMAFFGGSTGVIYKPVLRSRSSSAMVLSVDRRAGADPRPHRHAAEAQGARRSHGRLGRAA